MKQEAGEWRQHPLLTIWCRPSATIHVRLREVSNPQPIEFLLAASAGVSTSLNLVAIVGLGRRMRPFPLFLLFLVLGPLSGIALMYLDAILLTLAGQALGGRARLGEVAVVFAWSNIPRLLDIALWLLLISLRGTSVLASGVELRQLLDPSNWNGLLLGLVLAIGLWIYSLWSIGLAEAHQYPFPSAIATLLLSRGIVAIAVLILSLVLPIASFWGKFLFAFHAVALQIG